MMIRGQQHAEFNWMFIGIAHLDELIEEYLEFGENIVLFNLRWALI